MLGDLTPVIVAVITTAGTIFGISFGARRLRALGLGDAQVQVNATLRELADTERAKALIWQQKYADEVAAHDATKRKLELAQHDGDVAERRLDQAYEDLRKTGRTTLPRRAP